MNKYYSLALIGCFLASICYEWVFPGWDGYYISKLLIITTLSGILWIKLSYKELALKSLAFIVFLDSVWNVSQFLMNGQYQGGLELLNALIFAPWLTYAMFRTYEPIGAVVEPNGVYWIAHKPDDKWSFFVSLFGSPVGGSSLLIDHKVYGFHKGKFEIRTLPERANIVAMECDLKKEDVIGYLTAMDGVKWGIFNNCLILRLRLWYV
jgi:hypothetical protein